jgi:hypothetical protein
MEKITNNYFYQLINLKFTIFNIHAYSHVESGRGSFSPYLAKRLKLVPTQICIDEGYAIP